MKLDTNSLAHTQWECKYHIVSAPKYRRQIICGKMKQEIGQMIGTHIYAKHFLTG